MEDLTQWPTLLDMSKEECRRVLRKLELAAYSGVVSAFRGQGALSREKHRLLGELASALGLPVDRHRAELRRAANDDTLNTISHRLAGSGFRAEWASEGRRAVPLLDRGRPNTALTSVADAARERTVRLLARLPGPAETASYVPDVPPLPPPDMSPAATASTRLSPPPPSPERPPTSPSADPARLQHGAAGQVEGEVLSRGSKRRRSSSDEGAVRVLPPPPPSPPPPPASPAAPGAELPARSQVMTGRSMAPPMAPPLVSSVRQRPVLSGRPPGGGGPPKQSVVTLPTINTAANHKLIIVSTPGGSVPVSSAVLSSVSGAAAGDARLRPPLPDTSADAARQVAGTDKTGGGFGPARNRPKLGRPMMAPPVIVPAQNATRVPGGVKIITHAVPAGASKVLTTVQQPLLVVPTTVEAAHPASLALGNVRTGGGRVVTVSSGTSRTVAVRQPPNFHGYSLPPRKSNWRLPPASLIVLQKQAGARGSAVVRPARPLPVTPEVIPYKYVSVAAASQDQTKATAVSNSNVLSDILHATGIINQKIALPGNTTSVALSDSTGYRDEANNRLIPARSVGKKPKLSVLSPPTDADSVPDGATAAVMQRRMLPPPEAAAPAVVVPAPGGSPQAPPPPGDRLRAGAGAATPAEDGPAKSPRRLQTQSVTMEDTMSLLSQAATSEQARHLLRQAGIKLSDQPAEQASSDQPSSEASMELVGELDPQTGIFYPVTANGEGPVAPPVPIPTEKPSGQVPKSPRT